LGALAIAIAAYIKPQLGLAGKLAGRAKMYYLAKAGVKMAILGLKNDETESYDALNDLWSNNEDIFNEIELADGTFTISYQASRYAPYAEGIRYGLIDEERKININKVPYDVLRNFFEIVEEVSLEEASDIAASIIDWRDADDNPEDDGAESGYYFALDLPYPCKNADFEVLEELLMVKGMSEEIFNKVKDRLTVHGDGAVNINTADELVLQSMGMSEDLAEKIIHFRKGSDGEEATGDDNVFEEVDAIAQTLGKKETIYGEDNSQILRLVADGLLVVKSDNFWGQSFGKLRDKEGSAKIVFIYDRNNEILKYWREE